jgi:nucleoside-diphosphate-sugar epimerase
MPHILITGANGFVGATMIDESLKAGYTVTGCVRSKNSGTELVDIHPEWDASKIDFVEVADYTIEGVFDKIFQEGDYDYVLHIAAPMPDNPTHTDYETHFEKPSIQGLVVLGEMTA